MLTVELHPYPLARAPTALSLSFSHCQVYPWSELTPSFVSWLFFSRNLSHISPNSCFLDRLGLPLLCGRLGFPNLFIYLLIHSLTICWMLLSSTALRHWGFQGVQTWLRRLKNQEPFTIQCGDGCEGKNRRYLWGYRRRDMWSRFGGGSGQRSLLEGVMSELSPKGKLKLA